VDKPEILLSLPSEGWIRVEVAHWLTALTHDDRFVLRIMFVRMVPYENALNSLAAKFRASRCTHWLNIDADNPPTDNPLDYVSADLDYIGFPTPICKRAAGKQLLAWNVQRLGGALTSVRGSGIEEVEAVGTGCFLMARRVAESIRVLFARDTDEDGVVTSGNDIVACRRIRLAGFGVYAAWDNVCSHHRELDLSLLMPISAEHQNERETVECGNGR